MADKTDPLSIDLTSETTRARIEVLSNRSNNKGGHNDLVDDEDAFIGAKNIINLLISSSLFL